MALRLVLIATAPPAALTVDAALRRLGYDVVAIVSLRVSPGRFGPYEPARVLRAAPDGDLLFIASPAQLVPLLEVYASDVAVCCSFPARIPDAALTVPRYGIVNVHPGLLPRYPGPNPLGWALRNGDRELGLTMHRMTPDFDAGPIWPRARSRSATTMTRTPSSRSSARSPGCCRSRWSGSSPATRAIRSRPTAVATRGSSSPSTSRSTGRAAPARSTGRPGRGRWRRRSTGDEGRAPSSTAAACGSCARAWTRAPAACRSRAATGRSGS